MTQPKERPILFSAPMVRAILAGTKTQTRRLVKQQGVLDSLNSVGCWDGPGDEEEWVLSCCPYGQLGDRLWVRETFGYVSPDEYPRPREKCKIEYRADMPPGCTDRPGQLPESEAAGDPEAPRWCPSIHMPRWASRILLEVVSVRVERLRDISAGDAAAEGIEGCNVIINGYNEGRTWRDYSLKCDDPCKWFSNPVNSYLSLWESINGAGSRAHNPWVWVVEFKRINGVCSAK